MHERRLCRTPYMSNMQIASHVTSAHGPWNHAPKTQTKSHSTNLAATQEQPKKTTKGYLIF